MNRTDTVPEQTHRRSRRTPTIDRGWLMRHGAAWIGDTPAVVRRATAYGRTTPRRLSGALARRYGRPVPI